MICHGHKWSEIKSYTIDQIILFYEEALKADNVQQARFIEGVRVGAWGDGDTYEKVIKTLTERG